MASGPNLFDNGNDPLPDGENRPTPDEYDRTAPNYLVRRALVVGVAVVVIAIGAIGIGRLLGSGDDDGSSGTISTDWNRVALVDQRTGAAIVVDDSGDEQSRIATGLSEVTDSHVVDHALVAASADQVAVVDLDDDTTTSFDMTTASDGVVLPSGSAATMLVHDTASRRAVMVNGPTGDQLDTDSFDPVTGSHYEFALARSDTAGRNLLVTDSGNFQSVLFSFDRDTPSFFPGLALALDDKLVVTTQNIGNNANVSLFDHSGEPVVSAQTPAARAAIISGDTVVLVTADGEIIQLAVDSGDTDTGDTLDIGAVQSGHVTPSGDHLVVVGSSGTAIVDTSGTIVGSYPDTALGNTGVDELGPHRSTCLVLTRSSPAEAVLVQLDDGTTVAEARIDGDVLATADGCSAVAPTASGYDVIDDAGITNVTTTAQPVSLSPDGSDLVVEASNRLRLVPTIPDGNTATQSTGSSPTVTGSSRESTTTPTEPDSGGDATPGVDLGPSGRLVSFAQL